MDLVEVRVREGKHFGLESPGLLGQAVVEAAESLPDAALVEYLVQLLDFYPRHWAGEVYRYSVDSNHDSLVGAGGRFGNRWGRLVLRQ